MRHKNTLTICYKKHYPSVRKNIKHKKLNFIPKIDIKNVKKSNTKQIIASQRLKHFIKVCSEIEPFIMDEEMTWRFNDEQLEKFSELAGDFSYLLAMLKH